MICEVFLLLFMYEITLNWTCLGAMYNFVLFLCIRSAESATVLFSSTATNIFLYGAGLEFSANYVWGYCLWGLVEE